MNNLYNAASSNKNVYIYPFNVVTMGLRVLLLNSSKINPGIPPVGLEYLAEYIKSIGIGADVIDLSRNAVNQESELEELINNDPLAIGVSIRNIDYTVMQKPANFLNDAKNLILKLREKSNVPIILGGAGFSINPKEILSYVGGDFGIKGSGIPRIKDLLDGIKDDSLENGTILMENPDENYADRVFQRNSLDLSTYQGEGAWVGISTKLGCNLKCIYCDYPTISGGKLITRNPDSILKEVDNLYNSGIKKVFFSDSVFNNPYNHAKLISEGMIKRNTIWRAYFNPSKKLFTEELLDIVAQSNFDGINLGIDSGSDQMLLELKKGFTRQDIIRASEMCKDRGISLGLSILFGGPGESRKTIDETYDLIDKVKPDKVYVQSGIRVYGTSELSKIAIKEGHFTPKNILMNHSFYPFSLDKYVESKAKERKSCFLPYHTN